MTKALTPFQRTVGHILRAHGFTLEGNRCTDPLIYARLEPDKLRTIEVQLWRDGLGRVMSLVRRSGHPATYAERWVSSASPTEFSTAVEMLSAIATQRTVEHHSGDGPGLSPYTVKLVSPKDRVWS